MAEHMFLSNWWKVSSCLSSGTCSRRGYFSANIRGNLHQVPSTLNSISYQNVLEDHLIPFTDPQGQIFQHHSVATKSWLQCQNVTTLEWSPKSPHLNPNEHVWYAMGYWMRSKCTNNLDHLWQILLQIWNNIISQKF